MTEPSAPRTTASCYELPELLTQEGHERRNPPQWLHTRRVKGIAQVTYHRRGWEDMEYDVGNFKPGDTIVVL